MATGLVRWMAAALLLGISTFIAFRQEPRPDPLRPSSGLFSLDWWRYPVERNAFKRLPVIPGDLNDVFSPDGKNVWCVGDNGLVLHSPDGGSTWRPRNIGARGNLASLHFVDSATGWIVGGGGNIFSTADGGQSWQHRTIPGLPQVGSIQFVDRETGWISGPGTLAQTRDGGLTWTTLETPQLRLPAALHFRNRLQGWAVNAGRVWATSDGGRTWTELASPRDVNELDSLDGARGWAVTGEGEVLATNDGGRTWSLLLQARLQRPVVFRALDFVDPDHGWAVGNEGAILSIGNGPAQIQQVPSNDVSLTAVFFFDRLRGWVVGEHGTLLTTTDGGRTWAPRSLVSGIDVMSVFFVDPSFGWAATLGGHILATRDGGRTWKSQFDNSRFLAAVHFLDRRRGWAAGEEGLFSTSDGGKSWRRETLPIQMALIGLEFVDEATGWAIGFNEAEGALFSTANGGRTWEIRRREPQWLSRDVDFLNRERGWMVEGTVVYSTQDGGRTWIPSYEVKTTPQSSYSLLDLFYLSSVVFVDSEYGWVAGQEGSLFATQDGGATWNPQETGTSGEVNALHLLDRSNGWLVGNGGLILSTSDGKTWLPQNSGTEEELLTIRFSDRDHGVLGGVRGTLLWTEDGGRTWNPVAHERWPAPWYYLTWFLAALVLAPALRRPVTLPDEPSTIADSLSSDRPVEAGDPDPLDFQATAEGISKFLRNEATQPPVTLAITGAWGTGKSSLMNLVRGDLAERGFCPVWFNAWHHQQEESLLAALLQAVRRQAIPRWWRLEAWIFRINLLRIRGWRHWAPLLLASALFAFSLAFVTRGDASEAVPRVAQEVEAVAKRAAAFLGVDVEKETGAAPSAGETSAVLLLLGSLAALLRGFWTAATAFGAKPSTLLTTAVRGARVRDLQAQSAFRQQFATEFEDVTDALAPRRMTIFIDDLDRCQPQNVLQVLEAINFLVSSGDCFVILGLARQQVEAAVGLGFKEIADELVRLEGEREPGAEKDEAELGRRKRAEFARQYLHKLINLEVAVPDPSPEQRCDLLSGERGEAKPESGNVAGWLARQGARLAHLAPVALFLLVLAGAVLAGRSLSVEPVEEARPTAEIPPPAPPQPEPTPGENPTPAPTPSAREPEVDLGPAFIEPPPGKRHELPLALPLVAALLAAAGWILTRRPDTVVRDSPAFKAALRTWYPVIAETHPTPRSLKRFLNRLRYLAMRQRKEPKKPPLWKALWSRKEADSGAEMLLPEDSLVALAALEALDPRIFREHPTLDLGSLGNAFPELSGVFQEHRERHAQGLFRGDLPLSRYREEFLKIAAGVRTG